MVTASVVVPTFRRTASLRRTLGSCLRQCGIDPAAFEIVVVDNCPGGSARETVAAAAAGAPVAIRYVHEPRPGVSHARNAEIGRAHVCTPVTNAQLLCRLLLEKKTKK